MGPRRPLPGIPVNNEWARPDRVRPAGTAFGNNDPQPAGLPGSGMAGVGAFGRVPGVGRPLADYQDMPIRGVYRPTMRDTKTILFGNSELIILEPLGLRVFLQIRNARQSDLALAVNLNTETTDPKISDYELLPGEAISFEFFVPQTRIFAYAAPVDAETTGTAYVIVTSSDMLPQSQV